MTETLKYFVWEPSSIGPVACIWHGNQVDGSGKRRKTVGDPVALASDDVRGINELKLAYPIAIVVEK